MDIDQMKKSWMELNQRLEKSEKVNREAIKMLLSDKAVGGYDKIRKQERNSLFSCLLLLIMFPFMYINGTINTWYSFAMMELIMVAGLIYNIILIRTLPKADLANEGVIAMLKCTAKYERLFTLFGPIIVGTTIIMVGIYFCSIGTGYQSDSFHLTIYCGTIIAMIVGATTNYFKKKEKIKAINNDLEELRKFEYE